MPMGRAEIAKDTVQVLAESAATHVGRIATIVTGAVRQVAHEVGEWAGDVFEMRDAAGRAAADGLAAATVDAQLDGDDLDHELDDEGLDGA